MSGTVYLVGAGCGNPDLITWKGLRLLRACDAVLYDDLSSPKLLEETRTDCERLFVGKRYGRHSMPQAEINALLVAKAQEGKTVVRLKGGDPFVFGRGGEEVLALQAAGIPYEVVSGVSSAVAVPAAAGIPVTHRRLARSFHVITGHTAADGAETLTEQIDTLAKLEGTLVFLMGLHHLEEITNGLLQGGKPADTPAAVISRGTTPKQRVVRAKLCNLVAKTRKANLAAPARHRDWRNGRNAAFGHNRVSPIRRENRRNRHKIHHEEAQEPLRGIGCDCHGAGLRHSRSRLGK